MSSTYDKMLARHPILKVIEVSRKPTSSTGYDDEDLIIAEAKDTWEWSYKFECGHWFHFFPPYIKRVGDSDHCLICHREVGL